MASLSLVANCEAFLEALEKSGLLAAEELSKVRAASGTASDPKALARDLVKAGTLTKWQAAQLLHGFYLLVVGKFKLLDQISSGETGRVYLAEHTQIQRRHALKILSRRHASKPEVLKRFLSEAQQVCALDHRNLSHVYDVNQDGDKYYLVMEYVEGNSLQQRVDSSGPLSTAEAIELIQQAADGLAHAHEQQVCHGDLKPANLIVDASGIVKITDIGQGRLFETSPSSTTADETTEAAALAAAIYRAPELRAGGAVNERSDIYSLGSVLCYLLAGKPAVEAGDAAKLLGRMKDVPADLAQLCQNMMADDPAARPTTMNDVRVALAAVGTQAPTPVPPATVAPEATSAAPPKKVKRRLVAKAIEDAVEAAEAAKVASAASVAPSVAEPVPAKPAPSESPASSPADPFAGFAVQPAKKGRFKDSGPTPAVPANTPTPASVAQSPASKGKSKLPLIIGGAIGGGVLLVAGAVVAVVVALNWAKGTAEKTLADASAAVNQATAEVGASDTNPEANPESNPESNPEANPTLAATNPTAAVPAANPLTPPTATAPAPVPMPTPAVSQLPEGPPPTPTPAPMPAPVDPAAMPMPAPIEPEPPKPAPMGNPFAGFATSINLPKLEPMMSEQPAEALAPLVLGPCKVDEKALIFITLRGGDGAIRGGKQKFEIAAAQDGTALRDWEISLTGGAGPPTVVALLNAKNDQLTFQWTAEGAKQTSSPLLSNCSLHLTAGAGQHDVAFRVPIIGDPLIVELEKAGSSVKWNLQQLPDPKKIFIQVSRLDGGFLEHKFKERDTLEGSDRTEVWTGSGPDSMVLGLRIDSTVSGQSIQIKATPLYQLTGMPMPKSLATKKELTSIGNTLDLRRAKASKTQELASKAKGEQAERAANLAKVELEKVNVSDAQLKELQGLIEGLEGKGTIHFRVYYQTDDGPIDLLVTEEGGPAKDEAAKEDAPGDKPAG
jgi:serine/threonine protein kinase